MMRNTTSVYDKFVKLFGDVEQKLFNKYSSCILGVFDLIRESQSQLKNGCVEYGQCLYYGMKHPYEGDLIEILNNGHHPNYIMEPASILYLFWKKGFILSKLGVSDTESWY